MTESLLHHIWKYRLFSSPNMIGSRQEQIEIVHAGEHNTDAGPDFFNARLRIDGILLAGNVEIHVKTSDWLKHGHHLDKAYDNLILHAVFEHDVELPQNDQHRVAVLRLSDYITSSVIEQYRSIAGSKAVIPCGKGITSVPDIVWKSWLNRLAIARLEDKVQYTAQLFEYTNQHFEETLYITLCRSFGFKINNVAFELLAKHLPYTTIKKHLDNPLAVEALLFGTAGLLEDVLEEDYLKQLQNEFEFLRHKYQLVPLKKELWKFLRLRPVNFPTVRLAQLAALFCKNGSLFHIIERLPTYSDLRGFFDVDVRPFWQDHYRPGGAAVSQRKPIGESAVANITINTIVPYLLFMSQHYGDQRFSHHALDLLSEAAAEKNAKTRPFETLGIKADNALESQALIQLYDHFCSARRCLDCSVAGFLLKSRAGAQAPA